MRSELDAYEDMARHAAKSRVPSNLRIVESKPCDGASYCQGPTPCRQSCNPPEMACTAGEEPQDDSISPFLIGGAIALAFVAFFVGLGYFVGPEIEGLLRQMN